MPRPTDYLAQAIERSFNDDGFVIHPDVDGANALADLLDSAIHANHAAALELWERTQDDFS